MWNSVEVHNICSQIGGYNLNRQNLTSIVKNHFDDSLVVLSSPGVANIFTFRKSYHFCLQNDNDIDDKDIKEFPERMKTEIERVDSALYKI